MKCIFCQSEILSNKHVTVKDSKDCRVDIFECETCFCLLPNYESISKLSVSDTLSTQVRLHDSWWEDEVLTSLLGHVEELTPLVQSFEKYIGKPTDGKMIVEVGAGRGGLIKSFLNLGYIAKGCEPSKQLFSKGLELLKLDDKSLKNMTSDEFFSDLMLSGSNPDAIIYWHSLEHIPNGLNEIKQACSTLKQDGFLIFQVPLMFRPWIFPEHLFFLTENTLSYITQKCGVEVVSVDYDYEMMFMSFVLKNVGSKEQGEFLSSREHFSEKYIDAINQLKSQNTLLENLFANEQDSAKAFECLVAEKMEAIDRYEYLMTEKLEAIDRYEYLLAQTQGELEAVKHSISEGQKSNVKSKVINETDQSIRKD